MTWPVDLLIPGTPTTGRLEIHFSILQRKVLTPNDAVSLAALEDRLLRGQIHFEHVAKPFEWKFTRPTSDGSWPRWPPVKRPPRPSDGENTSPSL
jgi:hypothetical protein